MAGTEIRPATSVRISTSDPNGDRIVLVELFACADPECRMEQARLLGEDRSRPWKIRIGTTPKSGELVLIARATDTDGTVGVSEPVTVAVKEKKAKSKAAGDRGRDCRNRAKDGCEDAREAGSPARDDGGANPVPGASSSPAATPETGGA